MLKTIRYEVLALAYFAAVLTGCGGGDATGTGAQVAGIATPQGKVGPTAAELGVIPEGTRVAAREQKVTKCYRASSRFDKQLCRAVLSEGDKRDFPTFEAFEVTSVAVDLNGDGGLETVAWISSWGGTSGQDLFVLSPTRAGFRILFQQDSTWTPIILLRSKSDGWSNIAYLVAGGGFDAHFVEVRHEGGLYKNGPVANQPPEGEVLIGKKWVQSTFGPLTPADPKQ